MEVMNTDVTNNQHTEDFCLPAGLNRQRQHMVQVFKHVLNSTCEQDNGRKK